MNRSMALLVALLFGCGSNAARSSGGGGEGGSQVCTTDHVYTCSYVECDCSAKNGDPAGELFACGPDCTTGHAQSVCAMNGCAFTAIRDPGVGSYGSGTPSGGAGGDPQSPPGPSGAGGSSHPSGAGGTPSTGSTGGDEPGCVAWIEHMCQICGSYCDRSSDAAKQALELCDSFWEANCAASYRCQTHASSCQASGQCGEGC